MVLFSQLLANGIVIGATYALVAIGLTLIFGMMRVVNFAHGEFYMLGGYIAVTAARSFGLSLFAAIPLAMLAVAILGFAFEHSYPDDRSVDRGAESCSADLGAEAGSGRRPVLRIRRLVRRDRNYGS